jgi:hypothetical protein
MEGSVPHSAILEEGLTMISQKWRDQALEEIKLLDMLEAVTDEWTPKKPTYAAVAQARMLLGKIDESKVSPPYIMPTVDGGIDFEWTRNERELDITVSSGGSIEYLKLVDKTPFEEGELELKNLVALTDWLLGH